MTLRIADVDALADAFVEAKEAWISDNRALRRRRKNVVFYVARWDDGSAFVTCDKSERPALAFTAAFNWLDGVHLDMPPRTFAMLILRSWDDEWTISSVYKSLLQAA